MSKPGPIRSRRPPCRSRLSFYLLSLCSVHVDLPYGQAFIGADIHERMVTDLHTVQCIGIHKPPVNHRPTSISAMYRDCVREFGSLPSEVLLLLTTNSPVADDQVCNRSDRSA